jgi:hypothetical protein
MIKKILLLSVCLFVSSCGNSTPSPSQEKITETPPPKIETFESNYAKIIRNNFTLTNTGMLGAINNFYSSLYPSGYDTSVIRIAFNMPKIISGDISVGADAVRETYKKMGIKMTITWSLREEGKESIEFRDVKWEIVANNEKSRYYGKIDSLDITWVSPATKSTLEEAKNYMGKWWVWDYMDILSHSVITEADQSEDLGTFMVGYTSLIRDISENGTKNILPLLEKNPIFITSSSGTLVDNEYIYPIMLSNERILNLLKETSLQYSGSGMSSEFEKELELFLSGITSNGELRISQTEPTYYGLTLNILSSGSSMSPIQIEMHSWPEDTRIQIWTQSGILNSVYTHKNGEKSRYLLTLTRWERIENIIEYAGTLSAENIDANLIVVNPENKNTFSTTLNYTQSDWAFLWNINQSKNEKSQDIINLIWVYKEQKVVALTGSFLSPESPKNEVSVLFNRNEDDNFTISIKTPSGTIEGDGSLKKNDTKINLSAQWFSATLEHKNHEDGAWEGKLQLPVGLLQWNGKTEDAILTDFHIKWNTPFGRWEMDLTKKDDSVTWPYSIIVQWKETSSGTILLRKIPKYFDIRIDTSLPDTDTPGFFEFHNFTDLRWDKDAKVIEPENAESLTPILQKEIEKNKKSSRNSYSIDDSSRIDFTEL